MTWYAVSISPSATRPARTVVLSRGPRNGLRQTVELDETKFQIERDLALAGFHAFVPKDTLCIRDRKNGGEVLRTFPMLRGYAFVLDPRDWVDLEAVRGVCGLLGCGGVPIRISAREIASLTACEDLSRQKAEADMAKREGSARRMTRRMAGQVFPAGMSVEIDHPTIGRQLAIIETTTGRGTVRAMAQFLGGLVPVEVSIDLVREIAA